MRLSPDDIFVGVREVLVDAQGLDEDDVTRDANLMDNLGVNSIEILDITFRLERKFGIRIPRGTLSPHLSWSDDPGMMMRTDQVLERLLFLDREFLCTQLGLTVLPQIVVIADLQKLVTVDYICRYVEHQLRTTT